MRRCRDCGQLRPVTEFPVALAKTGTRRTRCQRCYSLYTRSFSRTDYQRHHQVRLATAKRYRRDHAETIKEHNRQNARSRTLDPEWQIHIRPLRLAYAVVRRAIKAGTLVRPDACQQCAKVCKPDAAQTDYTQPLAVIWLCRSCNTKRNRARPKLTLAHTNWLYFTQS